VEVGQQLSEARQRRNLTLADISRTTKIPVHLLQAIEHNDFDRLPQGFFTRAFVRAYANEVGVNADTLLENVDDSEIEHVRIHVPGGNVPVEEQTSSRSLLVVLALCAGFSVYSSFAWKPAAHEVVQPAIVNPVQPVLATDIGAGAVAPCVPIAPPVTAINAARRDPIPAPAENVVTIAAPVPVTHVIADDQAVVNTPAQEPAQTATDTVTAQPDQIPASAPVEQF
jgi:transcriptional regulator with XRE-family HTH domain